MKASGTKRCHWLYSPADHDSAINGFVPVCCRLTSFVKNNAVVKKHRFFNALIHLKSNSYCWWTLVNYSLYVFGRFKTFKKTFFTRQPDGVLLSRHHWVVNGIRWWWANGVSIAIFHCRFEFLKKMSRIERFMHWNRKTDFGLKLSAKSVQNLKPCHIQLLFWNWGTSLKFDRAQSPLSGSAIDELHTFRRNFCKKGCVGRHPILHNWGAVL